MQKTLVSIITILALLISIAVPNSHAMMISDEPNETSSNSHCAEMVMIQTDSETSVPTSAFECCDDCQCVMASCTYLFVANLPSHSLQAAISGLSISNKQSYYSDPTQDFFIPPKIS